MFLTADTSVQNMDFVRQAAGELRHSYDNPSGAVGGGMV